MLVLKAPSSRLIRYHRYLKMPVLFPPSNPIYRWAAQIPKGGDVHTIFGESIFFCILSSIFSLASHV